MKKLSLKIQTMLVLIPIFAAASFPVSIFWAWFVEPIGVNAITPPQAFGLLLLTRLIPSIQVNGDLLLSDILSAIGWILVDIAIMLAVGLAAYLLMQVY